MPISKLVGPVKAKRLILDEAQRRRLGAPGVARPIGCCPDLPDLFDVLEDLGDVAAP